MISIELSVSTAEDVDLTLVEDDSLTLDLADTFIGGAAPDYTGAYEATPTRETQTFATANTTMTEDFVVNPIPSNYGLITWSGSVLTVS